MSVTLIGTRTYARRWVRYEIFRSMARGNGMFGVHINSVKDKDGQVKALGNNPFDNLGIRYSQDGTSLELFEWSNGNWIPAVDIGGYKLENVRPKDQWGQFYQLSKWYRLYDWVADDGYNNFADWVKSASPGG